MAPGNPLKWVSSGLSSITEMLDFYYRIYGISQIFSYNVREIDNKKLLFHEDKQIVYYEQLFDYSLQ